MTRGRFREVDYHLLKRKTKAGKTVYYVGFLDDLPGKNGRPKYKAVRSLKTGNQALARKRAQEMIDDGQVFAAKDSLRDYLLSFWTPGESDYLRSKVSEGKPVSSNYCENNRRNIENYFLPYFEARGMTKLSDLTKRNLLQWRDELREKGTFAEPTTNEKGVTVEPRTIGPVTQNKVRQAVWTALQWAVDMDMLPYHPGQGVRRVAETKTVRKIFEREELAKLFTVQWDDPRAYAACLLAAETGMRMGEVRGLRYRNLHIDSGYLDVVENYITHEGLKPPKWGHERLDVPITPRCALALQEVDKVHRWGVEPDNFVIFSVASPARPMEASTIRAELEKAMKRAKLPAGRSFHSFRHSFISHRPHDLPLDVVQRVVGHVDDATTEGYSHTTNEHREAMRKYQASIIPFPEAK